jgi:acetyl-CoA carboxylase biotin carboxyl carrier protein
MELDDVRQLIELLKGTDVTELLYEKEGVRIKLRRGFASAHADERRPASEKQPDVEEAEAAARHDARLYTVTSPLVGTFYRSADKGAEPFVEVGRKVLKGQTLCIVEAMKLMNEIESDINGVVVKIIVENGQSVEYGEPLFLIDPD